MDLSLELFHTPTELLPASEREGIEVHALYITSCPYFTGLSDGKVYIHVDNARRNLSPLECS